MTAVVLAVLPLLLPLTVLAAWRTRGWMPIHSAVEPVNHARITVAGIPLEEIEPGTMTAIILAMREAELRLSKQWPPPRRGPIYLTTEQLEACLRIFPMPDPKPLPPSWPGAPVGSLFGIQIVQAATVVESTPYREGWLS